MTWQREWVALTRRIQSLVQAANVYAQFLHSNSKDPEHGGKELRQQARCAYQELASFKNSYSHRLPDLATQALERWLEQHSTLFSSERGSAEQFFQDDLKAMLPMLAAIESEVTFHLSDRQEALRLRSERAFSHLQRSIVADEAIRERWQGAFQKQGEVACERLGAAHLLSHGIWAFKAHAEKGRTDLIFQDRLDDLAEVERAAEGLVLTEWKKAGSEAEALKQLADARQQAERYAGDTLAGLELRTYRYLVVVTERAVRFEGEERQEGVVYRQINLAVDPEVPSRG